MNTTRPLLPLSWQVLLAGVAGGLLGAFHGSLPAGPLTLVCGQLADLAASLFLIWTRALAVPLIVSSILLGAVGLEPMRRLGNIAGKTVAWMAGSGLVAVLIGLGAAFALPPASSTAWALRGTPPAFARAPPPAVVAPPGWGWAALVLLSVGFAYYCNQLDDGHARLLKRLCRGVEEMLVALLDLTVRLAPWGIFAWLFTAASQGRVGFVLKGTAVLWYAVKALLIGWALFGLIVLPTALWLLARVNPWKYLAVMLPAVLTAFASGSIEETLPLTMHAVRHRANVSNRVAGVVLSCCAVFQREGLALGWVVVAACHWRVYGAPQGGQFWLAMVLAGWLTAFGAGALRMEGGAAPVLLLGLAGFRDESIFMGWVSARFVMMGGAALSVWSHACATAVIARHEGEYWIPGPPPDADELQRLKADIETVED